MVTIKHEVSIGMIPTEGWTAQSSHIYPPSRLPQQRQEPTPRQGNITSIRDQDRQQATEDSQVRIDNVDLSTDEPTPPRRGRSFGELTDGSSWDVGCQCSGTNEPCQIIAAVQEPLPSWVDDGWTNFSKLLMAEQQKPAPVESYQDLLVRIDQESKSRLVKARQQQDALITYKAQLANIEHQNKQRLAAQRQVQYTARPNTEVNKVQPYQEPSINLQPQNMEEVMETSNRSGRQHEVPLPKHVPKDNSKMQNSSGNYELRDYQTQMMFQPRHSQGRIPVTPQVEGNANEVEKSQNTSPNHALRDYHVQLMLLEQQNKKRLMMARQEQDNMMAWAKRSSIPGGSGITQPAARSPTEESRPLELRGPAPSWNS